MTGLIWKDLLVLRKQMKSYLIILALYLVLAALACFPSRWSAPHWRLILSCCL